MIDLQVTKQEEAILLGNFLGDGHIQKRGNSYRTKIQHGLKQQDYVYWKFNKLKRLCFDSTFPKEKKTNQDIMYLFFFLKSGDYLKNYHKLFYKEYVWNPSNKERSLHNVKEKIRYKKTITTELIDFLPKDPLLLAVWFMDDGHLRTDSFSGKLGTYAFSKEEHHLLQDYIDSAFNIKTNIVLASRLKNQYYLSIPKKKGNFSSFVDLIKPTIQEIPCMHYKIDDSKK